MAETVSEANKILERSPPRKPEEKKDGASTKESSIT